MVEWYLLNRTNHYTLQHYRQPAPISGPQYVNCVAVVDSAAKGFVRVMHWCQHDGIFDVFRLDLELIYWVADQP